MAGTFTMLANGDIGVGDSTPSYKLDVNGTMRATGATTIGGTLTVTGTLDPNGAITGDGGAALSGMLDVVTNDADGKTLTIAESGTVQTNSGASGGGIWNLPEASTCIGATYTFAIMAGQNMDINPDDADRILTLTSAAGDAIRENTVGRSIQLKAVSETYWVTVGSPYGTWADVD